MKNNQGFTLIELIVVIAIMDIIAGIFSFNRATGEINTIFNKISISNGTKTYTIELIPETGYHRIVQ